MILVDTLVSSLCDTDFFIVFAAFFTGLSTIGIANIFNSTIGLSFNFDGVSISTVAIGGICLTILLVGKLTGLLLVFRLSLSRTGRPKTSLIGSVLYRICLSLVTLMMCSLSCGEPVGTLLLFGNGQYS